MHRLARALVVSMFAAGTIGSAVLAGAAAPQGEALVFILAGQSNMVGQGDTAALPEALGKMPPNVVFFLDGERTDFTARPRFGPEVAFAHELSRALPDETIVLVKFAVGGTSLMAWAPDWTAESARVTQNENAGPLYPRLLELVALATPGPEQASRMAGVLWMQGERDARYPPAGAEYGANLSSFVRRLREDLEAPELPFLFGQVDPPADRYPATGEVRAAQAEAERLIPASRMVSTEGISKRDDRLHYDTEGQLELGRRFARAYLEMHPDGRPEPGARR